jgi:hypothetical protein
VDADERPARSHWAATVAYEQFLDDEYVLEVERLVVVRARGADDARRESGFADAEFHPASDLELQEWEALVDEAFTPRELSHIDRLVRKRLLDIASRLRRGTRPDYVASARDQALQLNRLRGKLEAALEEADDAAA